MLENASQHLGLIPELEGQKAGLPFWLFYLLLSIILLLIFINFLQNRNLRQKISFFLSGPRRRFNRLKLEVRLRQEVEKKDALLQELGKLAATKKLNIPELEELISEIGSLEEESSHLQVLWHDIHRKLGMLKIEKRKVLNENQNGKTQNLTALEEAIAGLEKEKRRLEEKIMILREQLEPHYLTIGKVVNKHRPDYEDLAFLYFQIDKIAMTIDKIQKEIDSY